MSESKTPRTDAATFHILSSLQSGTEKVVRAELAQEIETDLAAARAEVERLRKGAERYEFMRDNAHPLEQYDYATKTDNGVSCYHMVDGVRELKSGTELDAAIDAAVFALSAKEPT